VLGAEKDIIANHVATGEVKIIYWPMLDLGPNSTNAAAAAFCAGQQNPAEFWRMHDYLFENQRNVYLANRSTFVQAAAALGLDGPAFETCYDGEDVRVLLQRLDDARRANLVSQRPTFDVVSTAGDQRLLGAQPYETFAEIIRSLNP
jgi:protein-disulfide isomerase